MPAPTPAPMPAEALAGAAAGAAALRAPSQLGDAAAAARLCGGQAAAEGEGRRAAYFWSKTNGDAASTGHSEHTAPANISRGPSWTWKDETESLVFTHPCIDAEKNLYLANRNGVVRKFKLSGETVWQNTDSFGGQQSTVLAGNGAIMDGAIHVGFVDGSVAAIDMQTGQTRWKVRASPSAGNDGWSILAHGGVVIAAGRSEGWAKSEQDFGGNDQVVALDARDGRRLWTFRPPGLFLYGFLGSFADGPPSVVFADVLGVPYRVALCDGRLLWKSGEGRGNATFSNGGAVVDPSGRRVFVTGNDVDPETKAVRGALAAYDLASGARLWRHGAPLPADAVPAVGSLRGPGGPLSVILAVGDSPGPPDPEAERRGRRRDGSPLALASRVYAVDAATGLPTGWDFAPPAYARQAAAGDAFPFKLCMPHAWSSPAVGGDGAVYLGHMSGQLFAIRDANGDGVLRGAEVSSYPGGRGYRGSPGLAPGLLVATPCDGMHVFQA